MPNNKTPLEQFEQAASTILRDRSNYMQPVGFIKEELVSAQFIAAARQLVVSEMEGLKKEQYGDIPIWIAQSEINKVIKRYKPSLLELPESEQQAIYEKTAKESTKLQQDLINKCDKWCMTCGERIRVISGEEGTSFFYCDYCEKAVDASPDAKSKQYNGGEK